ncbi:predicted protein [Postia placenta Mad-698-R]|nr:predicted protein [Postia placenta Mad-698-R]
MAPLPALTQVRTFVQFTRWGYFPCIVAFIVAFLPRTTHGAPLGLDTSLYCPKNLDILWNLAKFLGTNYIAHAISVPLAAEVGRFTQRVTVRSPTHWAAIVSLFLPFGGLGRAILLVAEHLESLNDNVRAALKHGSIHIITRTEMWQPPDDREEIVFVRLPPKWHDLPSDHANNGYAAFKLVSERESHIVIDHHDRKIHGELHLPRGYAVAAPLDKSITESIIDTRLLDTRGLSIHRPPQTLNLLAAVAQMVAACITLKSTIGNQVERFGYAAYGLSVFPYALMSAVNVICSAIVGDFTSGYMLRTPILQEAERRGAVFDGSIGRVRSLYAEPGYKGKSGFTAVGMSIKPENPAVVNSRKILVVRDGEKKKEFLFDPERYNTDIDTSFFDISSITHDGQHDENEVKPYKKRHWLRYFAIALAFLITMLAPYAVIYFFSGFRKGQSTTAQRRWMMSWLVADQVSAAGTFVFWWIWQKHGNIIPIAVHYAGVAGLLVPAIGGLVTVGAMFLEDNQFGPCGPS